MPKINLVAWLPDGEYELLKQLTAKHNQWAQEHPDPRFKAGKPLSPEEYIAARLWTWIREEANEE